MNLQIWVDAHDVLDSGEQVGRSLVDAEIVQCRVAAGIVKAIGYILRRASASVGA